MNAKSRDIKLYLMVIVSAAAFIVTPFVGLSILSDKSRQLVDLKSQSKTADDQLASLAAAKKQLQKYSYFNDVAKTVIPNDKDQAQAVLDIFQMASASGIALQNIDFPASSLGVRTSPSAGGSASGSSSSGASPLSQAKPVTGIAGLYSLQLTVSPQAGAQISPAQATTYPKFLDFLSRIERDRRTAQISQINIQPDASSQYLGFTITLNIFIKP